MCRRKEGYELEWPFRRPIFSLHQRRRGHTMTAMQTDKHQVRHHVVLLLVGLAVPLLALSMKVPDGERVCFRSLPDYPLPTLCFSRRLLGVDCPGCGLTRSVIYLMHGRWAESLEIHRLGWFVFLIIVSQVPYRIWRLRYREHPIRRYCNAEYTFGGIILGLFVLNRAWDWVGLL